MNILTSYFNQKLFEAGLPDNLQIEYSLNYCQGDGVAFYGEIWSRDWVDLFKKVYPNQKRKHRMFERLVKSILEWENYYDYLTIIRNKFGYHYSHSNTMDLEAPCA